MGLLRHYSLIIVGSFSNCTFPSLPESWGITQFLTVMLLQSVPYQMTNVHYGVIATFSIGASLTKSYNLDQVSGGIFGYDCFY